MSSSVWFTAAFVSVAAHVGIAAWVDDAGPANKPRPPIEMQLAKVVKPPPPKVTPPPPPPPPPPPRKPVLVKQVDKTPAAPPPPDTPTLGIDLDSSAPGGELAVNQGTTLDTPDPGNSMKKDLPPPPEPTPPTPPPRPKVFPSFEVTQLPRSKNKVQPEVPDAFRRAQREALVVIEVVIDVRGKVVDARVLRHAEFGLDAAALAAAKATEFEPALIGAQPVSVRYQIPYRFKVRG